MSDLMRKQASVSRNLALAACFGLGACANTSHITTYQEATIASPPRRLLLALDQGEALPFGISRDAIAERAARAGFVISGEASARYSLSLTAAAGYSDMGSYVPAPDTKAPPIWIARPGRSLRARFARGLVLRVTAVLVDTSMSREVWRGTGTLRTADPKGAAPELVGQVLAKLPRG
jgi:hypothetical protein